MVNLTLVFRLRFGAKTHKEIMPDRWERELFDSVRDGDESAFRRVYDLYQQRVRLVAWRISHRADWLDDILNETWCRAFAQRREFDGERPFLVWISGIVRNVYREECRKSPTVLGNSTIVRDTADSRLDELTPEILAEEAEWLSGINECVQRLDPEEAEVVRLRFFEGLTLRELADRIGTPESTLRDVRIPAIFSALRKCMETKGIRFSEFFAAQRAGEKQ